MTKLLTVQPCGHCGQTIIHMNNQRRAKAVETRWVHKRGMRGDVETYAPSKERAIAIFRHYGFPEASDTNVAPGRMKYIPVPASDDFERTK